MSKVARKAVVSFLRQGYGEPRQPHSKLWARRKFREGPGNVLGESDPGLEGMAVEAVSTGIIGLEGGVPEVDNDFGRRDGIGFLLG